MDDSTTLYSTVPPMDFTRSDCVEQVGRVGGLCRDYGFRGALVYTDNSLLDPWLVAQLLLQVGADVRPLVAVQPAYMHPYSVAKMVGSLVHLYGRGVDINWVAGGFKGDLTALGDDTPHDDRYERLVEYVDIVSALLGDDKPVDRDGRFYRSSGLTLSLPVEPENRPQMTLSGSSEAGLAAARAAGATAIQYPDPRLENTPLGGNQGAPMGIRVGIIARDDAEEAWAIAHRRFPPDRRGQLVHQLAMAESDSHWHRQLSEASVDTEAKSPFWMVPFENYKTFCPYLVGDYDRVASVIGFYRRNGYSTFITDVPFDEEDMISASIVFERARSSDTSVTGESSSA